ncbi:MAG: hypothetical protein OXE17_06985 [Chloroflexi bacterium]|nr:hypothetical protein [Chloroflexota bacterium]
MTTLPAALVTGAVELLPRGDYSQGKMLNFIPRNEHYVPVLFLRTWAFWSVAAPLLMTGFCLLLLMGLSALVGAPIDVVAMKFLADVLEPAAQVTVQLWVTAFFMMAVCYGVSRQLIRRTLRSPLSAPLSEVVGRIRQAALKVMFAPTSTAVSGEQAPHVSRLFDTVLASRALPVSLLSGSTPRLE